MGFEEIFVFAVVGCVAIYHQRSQQRANKQRDSNQTPLFILWLLAVVLPSLAIAWTTANRIALPLTFVTLVFLLCVWIYSNFATSLNANPEVITLDLDEEKKLKDCFISNIYHLTGLEYRPQEIYCRGNLRSLNPKYAYETINQNIQKIFGDRFVCYLQENPLENLGTSFGKAEDGQENTTNYCFYLTPNNFANSQHALSDRQIWVASTISIIFTAFTVLVVGANQRIDNLDLNNLQQGIPYLISLTSIFIAKAIAQYLITKHYNLQFPPPLLLPALGGFGLLASLNTNFPKTQNHTNQRRILFDLAAIPTIAGLVISIVLLILGNWVLVPTTSPIADPTIAPSLLITNLDTFDFKNSIFTTLLQTIFAIGKTATDPDSITALSPLTLAGWSGLALSALQLMPFDLLDGGNLAIAMFGHRQVVGMARISRLVLLAIALLVQPWLRIYSLLLFLLPTPRPLVLNERIEIGKARDLIGMTLIAIALLIILPIPKALFL
jgi:membrane-associated protease RseP (regulator of RpoE activity)